MGTLRRLLPVRRITLHLSHTPAQVAELLRARLDGRSELSLWVRRDDSKWLGTVSEEGFTLRRVINYRNSFRPVLDGVVRPSAEGGSKVEVVLRPEGFSLVFMVLWASGFLFGGTLGLLHGELLGALAFGAPLFGYGLLMAGFLIERKKSEALLRSILEEGKEGGPYRRPQARAGSGVR